MKTWVVLLTLISGSFSVGSAAPSAASGEASSAVASRQNLMQDLYWRCGSKQRLEFGKPVAGLESQTVLLTEAVSWFRFQIEEQLGVAAENIVTAIDEERIPETLIMRVLDVRIEELPKSSEAKFQRKQLVGVVQYVPVWMTAQGQW